MVKKDYIKKIKNGDVMTRFWYTLKNLHSILMVKTLDDMNLLPKFKNHSYKRYGILKF